MSALSDTLSTLVRQLSMCELELSKLDSQLQSEFAQHDAQVCASHLALCCDLLDTDVKEPLRGI
jgi:hypothetical protein